MKKDFTVRNVNKSQSSVKSSKNLFKMLSQMLKQHQEQIKGRNETQEKLKKETIEAANDLTVNLVILIRAYSIFHILM